MKKSIKVSILAITIACSFAACKGKTAPSSADSLKAADSAKTKVDTAKADTAKKDTTKKK